MPDLTPITREEMFLDGNTELTPITREEMILAGEDIDVITRREWFLKKYRGSGGEIVLEDITITENGVVTAPSGKAYKKITTDVPLPENAYLLKDIPNTPCDIATFTDGANLPMPSLKTTIVPIQDLHGYDSPWVGGSGRNLFSVGSRVDGTIADVRYTSDDEYIYLNGTKQGVGYADLSSASNITLDSGTYYIRAFVISGTASNTVELYPYDGTNNLTGNIINNERTLTLSESKTFRFRFAIWTDGTVFNNYKIGIVISKTPNIDKFYPYSNICPISGWDEANVTVSPTTDAEDGHTYTIPFQDSQGNPMTCYGGTLSNENGVQTLDNDKVKKTFDGTENWVSWASVTASDFVGFSVGGLTGVKGGRLTVMCNQLKSVDGLLTDNNCYIANGILYVCISKTVIGGDTLADFKTYLASNNLEIIYPLATPQQIPQDNLTIATQEGVNNVWADCGQIKEGSYFSESEEE